jgi:hypothetical protein
MGSWACQLSTDVRTQTRILYIVFFLTSFDIRGSGSLGTHFISYPPIGDPPRLISTHGFSVGVMDFGNW